MGKVKQDHKTNQIPNICEEFKSVNCSSEPSYEQIDLKNDILNIKANLCVCVCPV